jgi:hypothetical protein
MVSLLLAAVGFAATSGAPAGRAERVEAAAPDLSTTGGILHRSGRAFSGHVIERDVRGALLRDTPYRMGLRHGVQRSWYAGGAPSEERGYRDGAKVGVHRGWWPNGRPRFEYRFRGGERDGTARMWFEDGRLALAARYRRGYEQGRQRSWNADGTLQANYVVRAGRRFGLMGSMPCTRREIEPVGAGAAQAANSGRPLEPAGSQRQGG